MRRLVGAAGGRAESQVGVIGGPDVGGGFGSKLRPYPAEYLAVGAAKLTGRPIKWIEGRTENLVATTHGRGQIFAIGVGAKTAGALVPLKDTHNLAAVGISGG